MRALAALFASTALLAACAQATTPQTPAAEAPAELRTMAEFIDCVRESGVGQLSAHRAGPSERVAENSLGAIFQSAGLGAAVAEIDVARTSDGVLILMHDRTLDRTTTGAGNVGETAYADLEGLTLLDNSGADTGEPVPTLAEALDLAGELRIFLQLDLKNASAEEVIAAVREAGAIDRVGLIAYRPEQVVAAHELAPRLHLSAPDALDVYEEAGVDFSRLSIWMGVGMPNPEREAQLAEMGLETGLGFFRFERRQIPADYHIAMDAGVDLLSVDEVERAVNVLGGSETLYGSFDACRTGE